MTELEKIQLEIDNDLRKLGLMDQPVYTKPAEDTAASDGSAFTGEVPQEGAAAASGISSTPLTPLTPFSPSIPFAPVPESEIITDGFYRETIKQANFTVKKLRMPWRRKLIIAGLICTLGTGTLGLGIGSALVLAGNYWGGSIKTQTNGENPTDSGDYGINSVSYVFSGGEGAQDATLSDMIELVEPSVVGVSASFQTEEAYLPPGFPREYQQNIPQETIGSASGIIFKEDGQNVYIATNDHVVRDAISVNVQFSGSDRPVPAKQVGMSLEADLAVISANKRDLRQAGVTDIVLANFGDSDLMEMGDAVIAIGNALGEGNIATQGIISATEKIIPVENRSLTVIQTDAAINFGNSGGALFNTKGEVIGINSAKLLAYTVEGMGFSISSNIALPILNDLMKTSSRPSIGIYGYDLSPELAIEKEIADMPFAGVYVGSIIPGMSAESAGIQAGDIITGFNGEPVFTMDQLIEAIRQCEVGETVEVNILRNGRLIKLSAELKETVVSGFSN